MSYPWLIVRGASANPSSLKFQALMNKQSIAENEVFKPESKQPQIISVHTEDTILLQDPFFFRKLRTKTQKYYAPFEPDGKYLKLWCRFNHLARQLKDESFSINVEDFSRVKIYPKGQPKLCEGPDDGVKGGTIVSRINYDPSHIDYFEVLNPAECLIGMAEATEGFSIYIDFMLEGEPINQNGLNQTIWFHVDDPNGDQGVIVKIGNDRSIRFVARRAAFTRSFVSEPNIITSGVFHKAFITYDFNGDVMAVRVDKTELTDTGDDNSGFPSSHENSVFLGVRTNQNQGAARVRYRDARWYRDLIFNNDHKDNLWNNGRSICAAQAIKLDGVNQYIDCGNDSSLWSQSLTKFSWSMWVYPLALGGGGFGRDVMRHGLSGAARIRCDLDSSVVGDAKFYIRNNADTGDATARVDGMVTGKWQQLIGSYNSELGTDNVRIYRNGAIGYQKANHTEAKNLSTILTLGGTNANAFFNGYIKDFKWWTNHAFNTDEAELEFAGKYTVQPDFWLKMVEGNGNPVDYITRTKLGTLTNGAVWKIWSSPRPTEFGSLAVAGYTRFNDTVDTGGFDITGYDDVGFDTQ